MQVVLVYLKPFRYNSHLNAAAKNVKKIRFKNFFGRFKVVWDHWCW